MKQDWDWSDRQVKYVSIVDDGTFSHQKYVFVPDSVNEFISNDSIILGASHGLFCLYDQYQTNTAVIWNPSIRKTVPIAVPKQHLSTVVGFGICPSILDPKLVKITCVSYWSDLEYENTSTQVEVFTLRGGTWRSPLSNNVPHKSIQFGSSRAVVDGVIYWDAIDRIDNVDDGYYRKHNLHKLIMSFDLTSEEFTKVNLPDRLEINPRTYISLSNLRESLAVLDFNIYDRRDICRVWLMSGHGCTRSFNKLYSIIAPPDASIRTVLGFRKNGSPIVELKNDKGDYHCATHALAIYELESKSITNIGIHGLHDTFFVHSYMETLLLLGH